MEEDCVYPVDPDELDIYTKKNSFLQSILEYSLAKGTSLSRVTKYSKSGDGRSSWLELKKWFEGQGSVETFARDALTIITSHKLTVNSHGGAEKYMDKFEGTLQDLKDVEKPYDDSMAKINFLSNIEDPEYNITKDTLEMDGTKDYNDALIEIRRRSITVEKLRNKFNGGRRTNKSKRNLNNLK